MRLALLLALCSACAALREQERSQPRAECVYVCETRFNPRSPFLEVDTFGPTSIYGVARHDSYLVVRERHLFRCTAP
jgi:hypothetical protein